MIRRFALTASLILVGAMPALGQVHLPGHAHMPPDSAHHAMMHDPAHAERHAVIHALLIGLWEGTYSSTDGQSGPSRLSIALDSTFRVNFVAGPEVLSASSAHSFMISGDSLRWTQKVADKSCRTMATFSAATTLSRETMVGRMVCEDRETTFTLHKKAE